MQARHVFIPITIALIALQASCRSITSVDEEDSILHTSRTPFPSTIPGVNLNGAHIVIKDGSKPKIIRSQAPRTDKDYMELTEFGVTDVLIFKKENGHEVQDELKEFKDHGLPNSRLTHIPMRYRDFDSFEEPCRYTVNALKTIREARNEDGRMILIHCTLGEDRTGYLAGLIRLIEGSDNIRDIFQTEMCNNGYSSGNHNKPKNITTKIDEDLTPVFTRMALLIKQGNLNWNHLDADSICTRDPFDGNLDDKTRKTFDPKSYRCP
jgi:protein tyrosine/serine phosphatase